MIKLIVLDVDGCLSDGKIIYNTEGVESKHFHVKDGLGITTWIKLGHHVAIITGRKSAIVQKRAKELGVTHLHQGIKDKEGVLQEIVSSLGLEFSEVAVIGDDLNDLGMLELVTRSFTPKDGVAYVQSIVQTVLSKNGGDGAVREMIDMLVKQNNQVDEFISIWRDKSSISGNFQ